MNVNILSLLLLHILPIYLCFFFNGLTQKFLQRELEKSYPSGQEPKNVLTKWIKQPVDHFDNGFKKSWKMRYFERLDLWSTGGPVYIFIWGESEAAPIFLRMGLAATLASETKGAMFMTEHRFYGESRPFDPDSDDYLANLKYLNSQQALADIAYFIKHIIKRKPKFKKSKIVVIGGSYPGNLAAWMKVEYPELIDAALAGSAPVLAKVDFYEYLDTVTEDFKKFGGEECYDFIKKTFKRFSELLKSESGIETLKKEEKICKDNDMTLPENQYIFMLSKAGLFKEIAQYKSVKEIEETCQAIISKQEVDYFWEEDIFSFKMEGQKNCRYYDFNYTVNFIREQKTDLTSWLWQTCTEFGYAQSSTSENQIFSSLMPMELYYKLCEGCYGPEYNLEYAEKSVNKTNLVYGGLSPNVEHVVFVNGETDPWHRLGILEDVSRDAPAILIPKSPHCMDLFDDKPSDHAELTEARKNIKKVIKKWIGIKN